MIFCSLFLAIPFQEIAPDSPADAQLDEIKNMISEISDTFAELSSELYQATDDEVGDATVDDALDTAQQLADSMEELLALLPEPPPSSGSGSPQQQQQQDSGGQGEQNTPQQIKAQPQDGRHEDQNGQGQNTPPPQSIFQSQQQFGDWGQLPPRLEQALQHSDPNDMPLRYRRLLIRYHRQATDPER